MRVGIATDHGGFGLKELIEDALGMLLYHAGEPLVRPHPAPLTDSNLYRARIPMEGGKTMKAESVAFTVMVALVIVMGLAAPLAVAQDKPQDKPSDNMQIVLEKIRADKRLLVAENMQLTEAEAKTFWPVYDSYQSELFLLRVRTAKLIKDYADAYEKMTNDTAKKLLDEYMTVETLGLKLRQAYLPKFRNVLPEVKVVRYYQIENKIHAALVYEVGANIPLVKTAK
jgi:hypothetical protein